MNSKTSLKNKNVKPQSLVLENQNFDLACFSYDMSSYIIIHMFFSHFQ